MFQTSAKQTIALATIWFALLAVDLQNTNAQQRIYRGPATRVAQSQVDYDAPAPSRAAQVQNARIRAQNEARAAANPRSRFVQSQNRQTTRSRSQGVRVAQNTNRNANTRVARQVSPVGNAPIRNTAAGAATAASGTRNPTPIIGGPTPNAGTYLPQHLRTAGFGGGQIVGGGSPILASTQLGGSSTVGGSIPSGSVLNGSVLNGPTFNESALSGPTLNGPVLNGPISNGHVDAGFVDYGTPVVSHGGEFISDGGCATGGSGGCDGGCGVGENYFECDPCQYSNGGCPPGSGDCWLNGFSKILSRGELFVGATAFRSPGFNLTDASGATTAINDASFGFYGGVNYGIPLCRLSCGFLSGQIGVRSVQTEFDENILTSDNRDQLFVTAGLYRRVDYGLQAGIVVDFLREEWFGSSSTAQIRGDVSWVYGASALGFRFATAQENDLTTGTLNGNDFDNVFTESIDQYRFYHRTNIAAGGFMDLYAGWSGDDQTIFGVEGDVPMGSIFALQSGFTYLLPDEDLPGLNDDAWNLYMGIAIRPRGRSFYGDYDRPLLPVADNGSFINRRTSN